MHETLKRFWASIMPIVGMIIFVVLFIVGIFVFSYLLIIGAIVGLILFCVAYIRVKIALRKKTPPTHPAHGRTIEHDDDEKKF
jgi:hypothetical protein